MLKAKNSNRDTKRKRDAMKEVMKDDDLRGLFVRVPAKMFKKLHIYLAEEEISLADWVKGRIEEI